MSHKSCTNTHIHIARLSIQLSKRCYITIIDEARNTNVMLAVVVKDYLIWGKEVWEAVKVKHTSFFI